MSRGQIPMDAFGECHNEKCYSVLPWDMLAIVVNDKHGFCSAECARTFIEATEEPIETVGLHDPQYHADRPENVSEDSVDLWREVESLTDALYTVGELDGMVDGKFRPDV